MNNKKKQTVAVAMATALGVSAMMSPVTVHAQEEDPATAITQESNQQERTQEAKPQDNTPVSEQGLPASEQPQEPGTTGLQSGTPTIKPKSNGEFTDEDEAVQAIQTALDSYPVSNETTQEELQDFLNRNFVDTGKLSSISVSSLKKTEATSDSTGQLIPNYCLPSGNVVSYTLMIPRLPKAGEVAIDKVNFPDDVFRQYVSDNFDTVEDGVLSLDEISNVLRVDVSLERKIGSLKGIEHFTALEVLDCSSTGIASLDVSDLPNLQSLLCNDTEIIFLDVSNNLELLDLYCYNTNIQSLNVSNNRKLEYLYCDNTGITSLDVRNHVNLRSLLCDHTGITSLDVSKNVNLRRLECFDTKIQSLDVSNNQNLKYLYCENTPLAWLNLGTQNTLEDVRITDSNMNVKVTDSTFNIVNVFEGIDPKKIEQGSITGAIYNKETGIMSSYSLNTPITYEYDCGTVQGIPKTLKVTLNLSKSDSRIIIENNLDQEYTGKPYEIPEIRTEGSKGKLTFIYSKYINGSYEPIATAPTNVGKYAVYIELAEDEYHEGTVIEQTYFEITQAKNSWTNELAIKDWKEHEKANKPTATAKFGDAVFTYSASENGVYTSEVPVKAGTWYVRAIVTGTENYAGLEDTKSFLIREAEPIGPNQPDEPTNPDNSGKPNQTTEPDQPMKPENSNDQKTSDIPDKPVEMVETSDISQSGILAVWSILSGGCIAALLRKKKKSNEA